jgi:hypothetical protein
MNKLIDIPAIEKPFIKPDVPEGMDVAAAQPRSAPIDWSNHRRTGNTAIDLVAQFMGYCKAKKQGYPRQIVLKPAYYKLFFKGMEVLTGQDIDPMTILMWNRTEIVEGSYRQFDSMKPIWR